MKQHLAVAATALLLAGLVGCGAPDYDKAYREHLRSDAATVVRYCYYGAVSRAQAHGCIDHVSASEVLRRLHGTRGTNAVRYGVGLLNRCLADSGPLCRGDAPLP